MPWHPLHILCIHISRHLGSQKIIDSMVFSLNETKWIFCTTIFYILSYKDLVNVYASSMDVLPLVG